jgi:hypothetical protein
LEFKKKMMNRMIDKMTFEEKESMMEEMMNKFMDSLNPEQKQSMMMNMMPKMMQGMMGSMAGEGNTGMPMMGMMMKIMGGNSAPGEGDEPEFAPWDMCKKMMESITTSGETAAFATPELRDLFREWCSQVEEEILKVVRENGQSDPQTIAQTLKISRESVVYLLTKLAKEGKLSLTIDSIENPSQQHQP